MRSIGILGVGELSEKVVMGLRKSGFDGEIFLSPRNAERAAVLSDSFGCRVLATNQDVVDAASWLLLGVCPGSVENLARGVRLGDQHTLVSVVAGVDLN